MYSNRDMATMKGGRMFLLIGGDLVVMEEDVVTADGVLITMDGAVITPDGMTSRLAEDEAVIIDLVLTRLMEV